MIDDTSYLRILDYKKEHLFEGVVFELLLRNDNFNELYNRLFNHLKLFRQKSSINPDVLIKGIENTKFEGKDADLEEAMHIMLLNSDKCNSIVKLLNNKYGYNYTSLIKFISYLQDRYYNLNNSKCPQLKEIGFIKENILEKALEEEHPLFTLLENANINDEFYNFTTNFDIERYKYISGIPENIKFKKYTVNFEIKLHTSKKEQDKELERIKKYLDSLKKEPQYMNKNDLSFRIEQYTNNHKETNLHILNHFYCYDMMKSNLDANTIKKLTTEYLKKKKTTISNNSLDDLVNTYEPIKSEVISKNSRKVSELLELINKGI